MRVTPPLSASLFVLTLASAMAIGLSACSEDDSSGGTGAGAGAGGSGSQASAGAGSQASAGAGSQASAGSGAGAGPSGDAEPASVAGVTERHNFIRANVSPAASPAVPPLVWSAEVAASAQAYADKCKFEHSKGKYGENLFASTNVVTGAEVVDDWASEVADYSYDANDCADGKACGHYTQVVWRGSERVGCAVTTCTVNSPFGSSHGGEWQNWVCQYDPPGNYVGKKPY